MYIYTPLKIDFVLWCEVGIKTLFSFPHIISEVEIKILMYLC